METEFYHLTNCKNAQKIKKEGLKANNDGHIYVFTDMLVANPIAKEQVFTPRYTVFKIDRNGINGKLFKDDVGELTKGYHRIIKQNLIKPKFLKLICEKKTIFFRPTEWDYVRYCQYLGMTRWQVCKRFFGFRIVANFFSYYICRKSQS